MYQAPIAVQNGAPIRLTLPWKYGFKSIKYLRKITFVSSVATESGKPPTFWSTANSREYGVRTQHSNLRPLPLRHLPCLCRPLKRARFRIPRSQFWANVNPLVPHVRWSQLSERAFIDSTQDYDHIMSVSYNGYEDQVSHLYRGLEEAGEQLFF